ncbi:MAG: formyl transferase [Hyphomicrobiaceae bacterium]
MRIGLIVDDGGVPRWVIETARRIAATNRHDVRIMVQTPQGVASAPQRRPSLVALLALERQLAGRARDWLSDPVDRAQSHAIPHADAAFVPDLVLRFDDLRHANAARTLTVLVDGAPVLAKLWAALLAGEAVSIAIHDSLTGEAATSALVALEAPHRLLESADAVLSHVVRSTGDAALAVAEGRPVPAVATDQVPLPSAPAGIGRSPRRFAADRRASAVARRRDERLGRAPAWQVGWRHVAARSMPPQIIAPHTYATLRDDLQRYYADPFVIAHDGRMHMFVEELPYATGRGLISHVEIGANGPLGTPHPVLEEPFHLSYPQVFADNGEIWMLPEAAASGRLTLYRAERFPDRWVRHAILIEEALHDATVFRHDGRWWMTAATVVGSASAWDTLSLWYADRLEGPWRAHPMNPVLVDARSARPAGVPFERNGALWRPAQDCRRGYGAALSLCRVTRLDAEVFAQQVAATSHHGQALAGSGPHTLNFAANGASGVEVIDFFAPRAHV